MVLFAPAAETPSLEPAEKWQQQSGGETLENQVGKKTTFWCCRWSRRRWKDKIARLHWRGQRQPTVNSRNAKDWLSLAADSGRFKVSCSLYWAPMLACWDRQRRCISASAGGWQSHLFPLFTRPPLTSPHPSITGAHQPPLASVETLGQPSGSGRVHGMWPVGVLRLLQAPACCFVLLCVCVPCRAATNNYLCCELNYQMFFHHFFSNAYFFHFCLTKVVIVITNISKWHTKQQLWHSCSMFQRKMYMYYVTLWKLLQLNTFNRFLTIEILNSFTLNNIFSPCSPIFAGYNYTKYCRKVQF